jgi:hypothetical protein
MNQQRVDSALGALVEACCSQVGNCDVERGRGRGLVRRARSCPLAPRTLALHAN